MRKEELKREYEEQWEDLSIEYIKLVLDPYVNVIYDEDYAIIG